MDIAAETVLLLGPLCQVLTEPLDIPNGIASLLLALPISLSIAMVYKSIKVDNFTTKLYVREVSLLFVTIVGFLIMAALILELIVRLTR